nr:hypothetical protein [Tanacetum cinerariifolium]
LSVLGAAKVSHFEIMCRVLSYRPSFGTFRASILKDLLPSDNCVNAELLGLLDHQRTIIRRCPEKFLCLVGPSRSFDDVYIFCFIDIGLLDFVKFADPFKVKTRKRTLAQREIPLNNETMNMTVHPFDLHAKWIRPDAAVASETVPTTGGKSPTALRRLESQSGPQGVSNPYDVAEDSSSTQDEGVWTHHASMGIIVSSSSGPDDDVASPRAEPHDGLRDTDAAFAGGVGAFGNNV